MLRCRISTTILSLLLLCCAVFTASAERIEDLPQPTNYVSDFAHVLSPATVQALNEYCLQVDRQAHAQIAVVTVKSLDGSDIDDYSIRLQEKWKVGAKGTDRGILILLATDDHKRRITTGYGLEAILPDGKVGDIGRQMVPYLRANDFDSAVTLAVQQVAQVIAADAGVTLQGAPRRGSPQPAARPLSVGQVILFALFIFVVVVFLSRAGGGGLLGFLLGMLLGGGGRGGRGGWGGGGGFGGGGDGGGGFGGFGGGGSGGGGASGDW